MGRLNYSDEEDYPGQFELFRNNMARSLAGKNGQQALRDLEWALLGLPEKRLIGHHLVKKDEVCANGALVEFRRSRRLNQSREEVLAQMREETAPACSHCWHQKAQHGLTCSGCDKKIAEWIVPDHLPLHPWEQEPVQCPGYVVRAWDDEKQEYVETDEVYDEDEDDQTQWIAEKEGVPKLVATAIIEANDGWEGSHDREQFDPEATPRYGQHGPGGYRRREETPEERYDRVLRWVQLALRDPHTAANRT